MKKKNKPLRESKIPIEVRRDGCIENNYPFYCILMLALSSFLIIFFMWVIK